MYKHSMVPTLCLLSLSSSRFIGLLKVVRQSTTWRQSVHKISHCSLLSLCSCSAHCPCFAHCCHDPCIVRNASNSSSLLWFHSVCASVSMITDNCLFLFLFSVSVSGQVSEHHEDLCETVETSSYAQIEAAACSYQVYVRTYQVCTFANACTPRVCRLCARSIIGLSPSSCSGV